MTIEEPISPSAPRELRALFSIPENHVRIFPNVSVVPLGASAFPMAGQRLKVKVRSRMKRAGTDERGFLYTLSCDGQVEPACLRDPDRRTPRANSLKWPYCSIDVCTRIVSPVSHFH